MGISRLLDLMLVYPDIEHTSKKLAFIYSRIGCFGIFNIQHSIKMSLFSPKTLDYQLINLEVMLESIAEYYERILWKS